MIDAVLAVIENEEQRNELAVFYSRYKNRLYSIAFSKLHNKTDAEDAVQEAFSRMANKPESFFNIPQEKRVAYADVMVRNISIDMFNHKSKVFLEPLEEMVIEDTIISLENSLFDKVSRNEILTFIDNLPTLQRNVLILHCFFGLSIDETAQRLNISLTAANKRLTHGRKAIRKFLEERNKNDE